MRVSARVAVGLMSVPVGLMSVAAMETQLDEHKIIFYFILLLCTMHILLFCAMTNRGTLLVAQLVGGLRYKPEGRGFDSRWCH